MNILHRFQNLVSTALLLVLAANTVPAAGACTIVLLTDGKNALFCNNEDWSDPKTRVWFIPGDEARHGCVFIGFENGWGQGGMNTEGLAYDWVAGFKEKWDRDPALKEVRGNPAQRMLESCSDLDEAIRFFEKHWEPSFAYARIFVGDRTGASAVIGAKEGRLHVERSGQSCAFGYRGSVAQELLSHRPEPSPTNAIAILRASKQEGQYATKYSNVFDLKNGAVFLYGPPDWEKPVRLDLAEELKRGGHYFDLPRIEEQRSRRPRGLTRNMRKF